MPKFDFTCLDCKHEFELYKKILDHSDPECPECESLNLRKEIPRGGSFILKGNNWEKKGGY